MDLKTFQHELEAAGVNFEAGLTSSEIEFAEEAYGFTFPPDLKEFLQLALPVGLRWPNWRDAADQHIQRIIDWPTEGICFDIENNSFWWDKWGERPEVLQEAFAVAKQKIAAAPRLIPVYSHRYLPATPHLTGNPVFSVYQTDIIYYGTDLGTYLQNEFHFALDDGGSQPIRRIEFWSDLVDHNNDRAPDGLSSSI